MFHMEKRSGNTLIIIILIIIVIIFIIIIIQFRMTFTWTKNVEKSSYHDWEFSGYGRKWVNVTDVTGRGEVGFDPWLCLPFSRRTH